MENTRAYLDWAPDLNPVDYSVWRTAPEIVPIELNAPYKDAFETTANFVILEPANLLLLQWRSQ